MTDKSRSRRALVRFPSKNTLLEHPRPPSLLSPIRPIPIYKRLEVLTQNLGKSHPILIQNVGGFPALNTAVFTIFILTLLGLGLLGSTTPCAATTVDTFYEGNEKFLVVTESFSFSQSSAQAICQTYSEGSTMYVLGLVRSSAQDNLLQEYLTALGGPRA